jgi:predicted Na+-dependent transporter
MFPLLGLIIEPVALAMMVPELYIGILLLCMLPSTVQSSIGFTAMGRGNVAIAVCSASASSFLGMLKFVDQGSILLAVYTAFNGNRRLVAQGAADFTGGAGASAACCWPSC